MCMKCRRSALIQVVLTLTRFCTMASIFQRLIRNQSSLIARWVLFPLLFFSWQIEQISDLLLIPSVKLEFDIRSLERRLWGPKKCWYTWSKLSLSQKHTYKRDSKNFSSGQIKSYFFIGQLSSTKGLKHHRRQPNDVSVLYLVKDMWRERS